MKANQSHDFSTPPAPKAEAVEGGSLMDYLNTGKLAAHHKDNPND